METIAEMATAIAVAAVVPAMEAAGATEVEVAMEEMAEMAGPAVKEEKVVKADQEATMDATGVMDK